LVTGVLRLAGAPAFALVAAVSRCFDVVEAFAPPLQQLWRHADLSLQVWRQVGLASSSVSSSEWVTAGGSSRLTGLDAFSAFLKFAGAS
jgi:hypothetical protein